MKYNKKDVGGFLILFGYFMIGFLFIGLSLIADIRAPAFWGLLIIGVQFVLFGLLVNRHMINDKKLDSILSKFD
jgi:hypothetical protein